MFRHPLYTEDIYTYLRKKAGKEDLQSLLHTMVAERKIYCHENMYMLEDNPGFSQKRLKGAAMANLVMKKAVKAATVVCSFPFVKGVCISGSLSKEYADERSDIDFFIITAKNRLWICRTLLHFYKKFTFITGRQHSFCMNYFLDESRLQLEEKNIFTATEMATLYPVYGYEVYTDFIAANEEELSRQFPNVASFYKKGEIVRKRFAAFKNASEFVLNLTFPSTFNKFLMRLTDTWWQYKWRKKKYPMQDYDLAMKTRIYVSKNHPANYQKKVLNNVHKAHSAVKTGALQVQ